MQSKALLLLVSLLYPILLFSQEHRPANVDDSLIGAVPLQSIYDNMDGWQLRTHKINVPAGSEKPVAGSPEGPAVLYVIQGQVSVVGLAQTEDQTLSPGEALELDNSSKARLKNTGTTDSIIIVTDIAKTGSNTTYLAH